MAAQHVVADYWTAAEARDWNAFADTLAEDVVYTLPQTRERVRGRPAYVQFNTEYPGDWHLTVHRIVAAGDEAVSWVDFRVGEEAMIGIAFFRFDGTGKITEIVDVWPEPYEPPPGREHLVEHY